MVKIRPFAIIAVFFLIVLSAAVFSIPPPADFWGTVAVNGEPVDDGLEIEAFINGVNYAQYAVTQDGYYYIAIRADDSATPEKDGGVEGDVVVFNIGGIDAEEVGIWHSGSTRLDLTIGTEAGCDCTSWQNQGCGQGSCSSQMRQTRSCNPDMCSSESRCISDQSCGCQCTSGACCDGCSYRSSSYKCQQDVTTDYECVAGFNCGQDVYVRHQDRYCSGSSAGCDGSLQWSTFAVYDDCTTAEKCANDDSSCNYDLSCGEASIECYSDSGCGTDGYTGDSYCKDGISYRDYREHECRNAGSADSYCYYSDKAMKIEDGDGCNETIKIRISGVEVDVDGKRQPVEDGIKIRKEAKPGSTVKFDVEVENLFTEEEDVGIDDVEFTVTIESVDDSDDLEEDAAIGEIKPERKKSRSVEFGIPLEVEEDEFDVTILAEGEDKNGNHHEAEWESILEIKKEKHKIGLTETVIDPEEMQCGGAFNLHIKILNIGSSDEENLVCRIENQDLDISVKEMFNLDESPAENSKFTKSYRLAAPKNIEPGIYPISIMVYNEDDKLMDNKEINLGITCPEEVKAVKYVKKEIGNSAEAEDAQGSVPITVPEPQEEGERDNLIIRFFRSILNLLGYK